MPWALRVEFSFPGGCQVSACGFVDFTCGGAVIETRRVEKKTQRVGDTLRPLVPTIFVGMPIRTLPRPTFNHRQTHSKQESDLPVQRSFERWNSANAVDRPHSPA